MTDNDPDTTDASTSTEQPSDEAFTTGTEPQDPWDDPPRSRRRDLEEYAELAALVGLAVLAAVAVAGLYTSTSTAVERLVAREYEPLFQAALNLVVLLVAGIGLSLLWRRRRTTSA